VVQMRPVVAGPGSRCDLLAIHVEDSLRAPVDGDGPALAIKGNSEHRVLDPAPVPAPALPGDRLIPEFVRDHVGIGRLLVVPKSVFAATGRHPRWAIHSQSPPANVQRVDSIVAQ